MQVGEIGNFRSVDQEAGRSEISERNAQPHGEKFDRHD